MKTKIPDKSEFKSTTSLKWKEDLCKFLSDYSICTVLELGSNLGYTTNVIAEYVEKVTSFDNNQKNLDFSKKLNKDYTNIEYIRKDVYKESWGIETYDMCIVDCVHKYSHVKTDIEKCIGYDIKYLVFDDYGLFPQVKKAVDYFIDNGYLEVVRYIGHKKEHRFPNTQNKVLKDFEGIICKNVLNKDL